MRLRPYRTADNKIEGVVVTFVEVTERREAEEALRQSEERYRTLVEAQPDPICRFLPDTPSSTERMNLGGEGPAAEPFEGREDILGGFRPAEGFGVGVAGVDIGGDGRSNALHLCFVASLPRCWRSARLCSQPFDAP